VRLWLSSGQTTLSTDNDALLQRLISSASVFVLGYLNRTIAVTEFDEVYDNGGVNFLSLRQWPVRTVTSIQFGGVDITQPATGNPPVNGWLLSPPTRLEIRGRCFPRGRSVVRAQYSAGYSTEGEPQVVPTMGELTVTTSLCWLGDLGVTLADGTILTAVTAPPGAGQYSVSEGVYTFATAQAGASVLVSYSSVPPDLEQAVIELVGERFRHKERIGLNSQSLAQGETVNYLVKDMSDNVRLTLERYQNQGVW
jgi:hypothetical protein